MSYTLTLRGQFLGRLHSLDQAKRAAEDRADFPIVWQDSEGESVGTGDDSAYRIVRD